MKVNGVGGPSTTPTSRPSSRTGAGFSLPGAAGAAPASAASAASAASGVTGMSALMALQGVEDATERRRRAIKRGSNLLDRLEELKLALLAGESSGVNLQSLARAMAESRQGDEEGELKNLLDQIDLRAAVEIAKAEGRNGR